MPRHRPLVALFGGPAGAGKSTLAAEWCAARPMAAHIELDGIRELIVSGLADPQQPSELQSRQYDLSVRACCALARVFYEAGYSVAIDDALEPGVFEKIWRPELDGMVWKVVIILPTLEETLARSASRAKRVLPCHTRNQHAACSRWPLDRRVDTTGLSVHDSLLLVNRVLGE